MKLCFIIITLEFDVIHAFTGSSCSKHSTKRDVESGSSEQGFRENCKNRVLTHCNDTGSKKCKEDWVIWW